MRLFGIFAVILFSSVSYGDQVLEALQTTIDAKLANNEKLVIMMIAMGGQHVGERAEPYGFREVLDKQLSLLEAYQDNANVFFLHISESKMHEPQADIEFIMRQKYYDTSIRLRVPEDKDDFVYLETYEEFQEWLVDDYAKFQEEHDIKHAVLMGAEDEGDMRDMRDMLTDMLKEFKTVTVAPSLNAVEPDGFGEVRETSKSYGQKMHEQNIRNETNESIWENLGIGFEKLTVIKPGPGAVCQ